MIFRVGSGGSSFGRLEDRVQAPGIGICGVAARAGHAHDWITSFERLVLRRFVF